MQFKEESSSSFVKEKENNNNKKVECQLIDFNSAGADLSNLIPQSIRTSDPQLLLSLWNYFPFVFRMQDRKPSRPSLLYQVFLERGWRDYSESSSGKYYSSSSSSPGGKGAWNLWWGNSFGNKESLKTLDSWQSTNHLFKGISFCRKDVLARNLKRLHKTFNFNGVCDFSPKCYSFPGDYTNLLKRHTRRLESDDGRPIWIAKPIAKSQGKGIIIFDNPSNFGYDDRCVVQEYIRNPLLIDGYKWDLRLYICVTCQNPLTIYAYTEGITRFATKKYNLDALTDIFSHLTNTSLNKGSPLYKKNKTTIGIGSKWTLGRLRSYLKAQGINDFYMWQKIWSILILTIIGHGRIISNINQSQSNSFEFLGFDILIDEKLKPHLLEVNTNPALSCDVCTGVDESVKKPMLHELFDLLGFPDGRDFRSSCNKLQSIPSLTNVPFKHPVEVMLKKLGQSVVVPLCTPRLPGSPRSEENLWQSRFLNRNDCNDNNNYVLKYPPNDMTAEDIPLKTLLGDKDECRRKCTLHDNCETMKCDELMQDTSSEEIEEKPNLLKKRKGKSSVSIVLPSLTTSKSSNKIRCQIPTNGPGITLERPNWSRSPPKECGKWIRIFPFNSITAEKADFQSHDASRIIITQVAEYLKLCKEVTDGGGFRNGSLSDEEIETVIQRQSKLSTAIWYPRLDG